MQRLEARLRGPRSRRFYGAFRLLREGEEYFACVERTPDDEPATMGLEVAVLPGGLYARRKVHDWERVIAEGSLASIFHEMAKHCDLDLSRPYIEFYRSRTEIHLIVPVLGRVRPLLASRGP